MDLIAEAVAVEKVVDPMFEAVMAEMAAAPILRMFEAVEVQRLAQTEELVVLKLVMTEVMEALMVLLVELRRLEVG